MLLAAAVLIAVVPPAGAGAAVGGITDIADRQERASCKYARANAAQAKRTRYAAACRRASEADAAARIAAFTPVTYENPVHGATFPDPGIVHDGSADYYAYATGGGFPIIKSTDLVHWEQVGRAFASRPSWVVQTGDSHPWAPSVLRSPRSCPGTASPGCYFMYYVGLSGEHAPVTHCIGVAWSLTASGPFNDLGPLEAEDGATDLAGRPPGCGDAEGYGHIDPAPFADTDGRVYLYVSTSRRCAQPTTSTCPYEPVISVYELTETLTKLASERKPLFGAAPGTWEQEPGRAAQVENPWVEKRGDTYYLFYSGGDYRASYGMGYATGSSPTGPDAYPAFAKSGDNPVLAETADVLSPGGGSVTTGPDGGSWLVYHGRADSYAEPRTLRIDPLYWSGSSFFTTGPTTGPQVVEPNEPPPPDPDPGPADPFPHPTPTVPTVTRADVTAPGLALGGKRRQRARRRISVSVSSTTENMWATVSGAIRIGPSRKLQPVRGVPNVSVRRGRTREFTLRMSRRTLRAVLRGLRRHRKVTVRVAIEVRDAAGNTGVARRTIRLVR